jgi:bifunctional non-homologous end joining protein LigD
LPELGAHGIHGFEGVVLEDFFADFIPDVFLRIEFRGIGRKIQVLYGEHFEDGADLYARATALGLEGIVSKRADAPYRSGRGEQWVKVKCWKRERFAVIGFVSEGSSGLLKLRLARREGNTLIYVGRVGTGWDREMARDIRASLEPLARSTPPLPKPLKKADTAWLEPRFDAEITYAEIMGDGMVRHPSFKALRPHRS